MKLWKLFCSIVFLALMVPTAFARVYTVQDEYGWRLFDDDKEVEVKGITWSNNPIGVDYSYSLWSKDPKYIKKMIDTDMPLLRAMGVNAVRCFKEIPPEWVEYIYREYGIYTIINDLLGRYGVSVNGAWHAKTDYSDPATRKVLVNMARETATKFRNVEGILMYMWGNESNYGLEWSGTEIENLPVGEQHRAKAVYLYSLFNEVILAAKEADPDHPNGIVNGDTQYIDLVASECPALDIFGSNVYRGWKFYDAFYEDVERVLDKPVIITECGADAYNALTRQEDQWMQMQYIKSQQREVYGQSYGKGRCANILGCFLFEWVDEWWKVYQYKDLTVHNSGNWANGGYSLDYKDGVNNMDEEWFGICAQSKETVNGINKRLPRAVYYMLCDVWAMSMYNCTDEDIDALFDNMPESIYLARGNSLSDKNAAGENRLVSIDQLEVSLESTIPAFVNKINDDIKDNNDWKPDFRYANKDGDTVEIHNRAEVTLGVAFTPLENLSAHAVVKAWTAAPYTNLGDSPEMYTDDDGDKKYFDFYSVSAAYENPYFDLLGYYHTGHGSLEGQGDLFNITREAYDLSGYDSDGSKAPIGLEFDGRNVLNGLTLMVGPELWDGARPQFIANYYRSFSTKLKLIPSVSVGLLWDEEFGSPKNKDYYPYDAFGAGRNVSLTTQFGNDFLSMKLGALIAGTEKVGAAYTSDSGASKEIDVKDTFGAYAYLGVQIFPYANLFVEGAYRGLVADTNPGIVYNGGYSADSGSGNRMEVHGGVNIGFGNFSLLPSVRYRKPIEKPCDRALTYGSPFTVGLGNREALELEAVFTYDSDGSSYFYAWDNADSEQAPLAFSVAGQYTLFAKETDSLPYKGGSGTIAYSYNADGTKNHSEIWYESGAMPRQRDLWQVGTRLVLNPLPSLRLIGTFSAGRQGGTAAAYAEDRETVRFWTAGLACRYRRFVGSFSYLRDYWGPESWWRNFNMTFPEQFTLDLAYSFKDEPSLLNSKNRVGLRFVGRRFNTDSSDAYNALPDYALNADGTVKNNNSLYVEMTAYLHISF